MPQMAKIGVIAKSPIIRKTIEFSLGREGYVAQSFDDPRQLLAALANGNDEIPALLFVDLDLPPGTDIDAFELIKRVRTYQTRANVHICIISQRHRPGDRLKAWMCEVEAYITKPITMDQVVALVQKHVGAPTK